MTDSKTLFQFNLLVDQWNQGPGRNDLMIWDERVFHPSIPLMTEGELSQNVKAAAMAFDCLAIFLQFGNQTDDNLFLVHSIKHCIWDFVAKLTPKDRCFCLHLEEYHDSLLTQIMEYAQDHKIT